MGERDVESSRERCEQQSAFSEEQQTLPNQPPLRQANIDRAHVLHSKRLYWLGRRTQDIILSAIALLILWPFMLIIAAIIWIDSPGASPIFAQERVGRDGKCFKFLNLRWMKTIDNSHRECTARRPVSCATRIIQKPECGFRHQSGHFKPAAAAERGAFRRPSEPAPIHRTA